MSKVTIYVPGMKLKLIKDYCTERKVPMSTIFTRGAMGIINKVPLPKCKFCSRPSIGKFKVNAYDPDLGDITEEVTLCQSHYDEVKKRNEVNEI